MSESHSVVSLCDPMDTVHGILQVRILEWVVFPLSRASSQPRDRTQVYSIAGRFFSSWATGKPNNTGVGSISFLHRIFLNQELSWNLLHCRWILYQLSYQGSPSYIELTIIWKILYSMTLGLFLPCLCFLCYFSPFSSFQLIGSISICIC